MSKNFPSGASKISQKPKGSLTEIYRRLLREYAFRHWIYMTIGILFAFIEGGALMSLCHLVGMVASSFEGGNHAEAVQVAAPSSVESDVMAMPVVPEASVLPVRKQTKEEKQNAKISHYVDSANEVLRKFGLPEVDKGDGQHLTLGIVQILLCGLVVFFILQALAVVGNRYCLKWVGARVVTDMRMALYNHLLDQSQAFYSREESGVGSLISRCTNDIAAVEGVIAQNFPELVVAPVQILAAGIFLVQAVIEAHLSWNFAIILVLMSVMVLPVYGICRILKKFEHRVLDSISDVTDRMQESYSGIRVIRAFGQEEREKESFRYVSEKYFRALRRAIRAELSVHPILQTSAMLMVGVFVWLCYKNGLTVGVLGGMAFAAQSIYKPVKDLVKVNAGLQRGAAAAERFFEVMDLDYTLPVPERPRHIAALETEIRFEDVAFRYTPAGMDILKGVDIVLKKGEMIALVGQTGSGKSTIANLLARFYDPSAGRITIDGVDLREIDVKDFRGLVGVVSQDTFLFNTTIEENIRYGRPDASHAEVIEAARQANALEFIEADPEGFQRKVGERGDLLSGGQKQRIAIARAILRNPPILILDEATSALDTVTEQLVQEAINNVMKDRTVLAIAHRLSTVRNASCILVLDGGQIVEKGTDEELRAAGGIYSRLARLQFQADQA